MSLCQYILKGGRGHKKVENPCHGGCSLIGGKPGVFGLLMRNSTASTNLQFVFSVILDQPRGMFSNPNPANPTQHNVLG